MKDPPSGKHSEARNLNCFLFISAYSVMRKQRLPEQMKNTTRREARRQVQFTKFKR